jgi:hypothetical protein
MKSNKKKIGVSPFWKPEKEGEILQGKFFRFETTNKGLAMRLDTKLVGMGIVLLKAFKPIAKKMKIGDNVKLEYIGKSKRTKLYNIWINDKSLDIPSSFEPIAADKIDEIFDKTISNSNKKSKDE